MGLFGKSFDEKVAEAVESVRGMNLGVRRLDATIDDKVVTLTGEAPNMDVKKRVMMEFNALVETENTINTIRVASVAKAPVAAVPAAAEAAPEAAEAAAEGHVYEVQPGDTLGKISKEFYGKASLYMKIFEANRDILDNPDLIKVGQKLRIPE